MEGLSSPVWIRMPNLPLQYWDESNISRIASRIGLPLWIDTQTGNWVRREYARVEYEGIGLMCYGCGRVGHRRDSCPFKSVAQAPSTSEKPSRPEGSFEKGESSKAGGSRSNLAKRDQGQQGSLETVREKMIVPPNETVILERDTRSASLEGRGGGRDEMMNKAPTEEDLVGPWIQVPPRRRKGGKPLIRSTTSSQKKTFGKDPKAGGSEGSQGATYWEQTY
ncbi:uncharacterized protein LOC110093478 [Dendrobium catenatum]|uniref:uncharacterized protein LOC110093478 n=1 Tax=Dendrobium catenatum TaxID=906689 RepID=UPI0009F31086|nr:uncharacterized protein LOC110093478 [Dendrobium catenatum]